MRLPGSMLLCAALAVAAAQAGSEELAALLDNALAQTRQHVSCHYRFGID